MKERLEKQQMLSPQSLAAFLPFALLMFSDDVRIKKNAITSDLLRDEILHKIFVSNKIDIKKSNISDHLFDRIFTAFVGAGIIFSDSKRVNRNHALALEIAHMMMQRQEVRQLILKGYEHNIVIGAIRRARA